MKNPLLFILIIISINSLTVSAQSWLWAVQDTSPIKTGTDEAGVSTNKTGNVYQTGLFDGPITFGTTNLTTTNEDLYLVKYDQNGNLLWVTQSKSNGSGPIQVYSVATDDSDNAYVTGTTVNPTVFGNFTLYGSDSVFLVKYDPNGNVVWAKQPAIWAIGGYAGAVTTDNFGHEYSRVRNLYLE